LNVSLQLLLYISSKSTPYDVNDIASL